MCGDIRYIDSRHMKEGGGGGVGGTTKYFEALSCKVHPSDESQSLCKAATVNFQMCI